MLLVLPIISNTALQGSRRCVELDAVIDGSPIAMYFSQFVGGLQFAGVLEGTEGGLCDYGPQGEQQTASGD